MEDREGFQKHQTGETMNKYLVHRHWCGCIPNSAICEVLLVPFWQPMGYIGTSYIYTEGSGSNTLHLLWGHTFQLLALCCLYCALDPSRVLLVVDKVQHIYSQKQDRLTPVYYHSAITSARS